MNNFIYYKIINNKCVVFKFRCEQEYLEFRDGAAQFSQIINHICQFHNIMDIETKDNFLFIKYFTDLSVPSNGFKLSISIGINILLNNLFIAIMC